MRERERERERESESVCVCQRVYLCGFLYAASCPVAAENEDTTEPVPVALPATQHNTPQVTILQHTHCLTHTGGFALEAKSLKLFLTPSPFLFGSLFFAAPPLPSPAPLPLRGLACDAGSLSPIRTTLLNCEGGRAGTLAVTEVGGGG